MIFITGGASQGKKNFAETMFPGTQIVESFQIQIRQWLNEEKDVLNEVRSLLKHNPDAVILMNEMGCGITPMNILDRRLRDEVGQAGCYLAREATEVYRVIAGIGTKIK